MVSELESNESAAVPQDVSIIIVNHNYADYLRVAIESALSQSVPPLEIVVVDDGSDDGSRDIIVGYAGSVVPLFKSKGGHVSAVNAGFAASKGDICIFLDADDCLYADCIAHVLAAWRPSDVKIQYRLDTIDIAGGNQNMAFPYFPASLDPAEIRRQSYLFGDYPWTVSTGNAFAHSFLEQLLPIDATEIYRSPDGYINKMAPLFGDVRSLQAILGAYRVHGKNTWAQDSRNFRIEPIIRSLKFDIVLQGKFENIAAQRGIDVRTSQAVRSPQLLEYRLLGCRFAAGQSPFPRDTPYRLFRESFRVVAAAPNLSLPGRVVWFAWLTAISFLPLPMVKRLFENARGQTGRTLMSRMLVRLSRSE